MDMTEAVEHEHVMEITSVPLLINWQPRSRCFEAGEELIICEYQTTGWRQETRKPYVSTSDVKSVLAAPRDHF